MKSWPCIFVLLFIFNVPALAQKNQPLSGKWKGYILLKNVKLLIKASFETQGNNDVGSLDIPQQQAFNIPLHKIKSSKGDSIIFQFGFPPNLITFQGVKNDSTINGIVSQKGQNNDFILNQVKQKKVSTHGYEYEEVIIKKNDSTQIGGTLTWPKAKKTDQLVILISGSGAQNRNARTPNTSFEPFLALADSLTMNGLATFRYDDRGVGKSTGNYSKATLDTLASDVETIIGYFSNDTTHHFNNFTLLGHSQGGVVAGKTAVEDTLVDKLILMSSPSIPLKQLLNFQVRQKFISNSIPRNLLEPELVARESLMTAIKKGQDIVESQQDYKRKFEAVQKYLLSLANRDTSIADQLAHKQAERLKNLYSSPQMQSLLFYPPIKDIKQLNIPVLALFGGKDTQVPPNLNKNKLQSALRLANIPYQIEVFENANHLFQKTIPNKTQEQKEHQDQFIKGLIPTIVLWTTQNN